MRSIMRITSVFDKDAALRHAVLEQLYVTKEISWGAHGERYDTKEISWGAHGERYDIKATRAHGERYDIKATKRRRSNGVRLVRKAKIFSGAGGRAGGLCCGGGRVGAGANVLAHMIWRVQAGFAVGKNWTR